jgi:hypothetical protein
MQSTDINPTSRAGTPEQSGENNNQPASAAANLSAPMQNLAVSDTAMAAPLTTLEVKMGGFTRAIPLTTFSTPARITKHFTAWSESPAVTITNNTMRVNLNLLMPAAAALSDEVLTSHLDAVEALVNSLQQQETTTNNNNNDDLTVANLWRLAGINQEALGLDQSCINMTQTWMDGVFVGRLKKPATWFDGPGGMEEFEDEEDVADQDWERALNACFVFGWEASWRAIAARLAYLCGVEVDGETTKLVKRSGNRLDIEVCGNQTAGE